MVSRLKRIGKAATILTVVIICTLVLASCVGARGERGFQGEQGMQGAQGESGGRGEAGLSAFEIFLIEFPAYAGDQAQWVIDLASGQLLRTVTFKAAEIDDIIITVLYNSTLTDIPDVPFKEGYIGEWDIDFANFYNITSNLIINALYFNDPPTQFPICGCNDSNCPLCNPFPQI
jgi:hypothetical protein